MRSWEADEQVAELLDLAVKTTGASLRDIVNEAIRVHAPGIIMRLLEERGDAERKLRGLLEEKYGLGNGDTGDGERALPVGSGSPGTGRRKRKN